MGWIQTPAERQDTSEAVNSRVCVCVGGGGDQMRSIISWQELDDHPVSTTLRQHSPTHGSAGTLEGGEEGGEHGEREEAAVNRMG